MSVPSDIRPTAAAKASGPLQDRCHPPPPPRTAHAPRPFITVQPPTQKKRKPTSPMKTIPTASPASSSSAYDRCRLVNFARSATASPRPTTTVDYRANVERQIPRAKISRQYSDLCGLWTTWPASLSSAQVWLPMGATMSSSSGLNDQSTTVSELDATLRQADGRGS